MEYFPYTQEQFITRPRDILQNWLLGTPQATETTKKPLPYLPWQGLFGPPLLFLGEMGLKFQANVKIAIFKGKTVVFIEKKTWAKPPKTAFWGPAFREKRLLGRQGGSKKAVFNYHAPAG